MAVTYSDMFMFVTMLTGVITLCYLIFKDKKKQSFLHKIRNTAHLPIVRCFKTTNNRENRKP